MHNSAIMQGTKSVAQVTCVDADVLRGYLEIRNVGCNLELQHFAGKHVANKDELLSKRKDLWAQCCDVVLEGLACTHIQTKAWAIAEPVSHIESPV